MSTTSAFLNRRHQPAGRATATGAIGLCTKSKKRGLPRGWERRFGTTSQNPHFIAIHPVVNHPVEHIDVGASGEWVEEALTAGGDAIGHAGRLERRASPGYRAREVDQRPMDCGVCQ